MSVEARTSVVLPDPQTAMKDLVSHVSEHGIDPEYLQQHRVRFNHEGCVIEFASSTQTLDVLISAPSANMLYFIKEAAAGHIVEIDPAAGARLRWSDDSAGEAVGVPPANFQELAMVRRTTIIPGIVRLTFKGGDVAGLVEDGLHIKLMRPQSDNDDVPKWPTVAPNGTTAWPQGDDRLHVRYFTLRGVRADVQEIDVDVVVHPGGRISDWAIRASPGDLIGVMGPGGGSIPMVQGSLFLCGDETALPAIARILEALPQSAIGNLLVALPEKTRVTDYLPATSLKCHILQSGVFRSECVADARRILNDSSSPDYAWFAGEFSNANAMRRFFKDELGLSKGQQLSVAYWQRGRRGNASSVG